MWLLVATAIIGCLGIGLGAYAEHGLRTRVDGESFRAVMTALRYHQVHAVALLAICLALMMPLNPVLATRLGITAGLFVLGLILFCGSIYAATMLDMPSMTRAAPAGGMTLMLAWLSLIWVGMAA